MVDNIPFVVIAELVDIGGEHLAHLSRLDGLREIFNASHPRHMAVQMNGCIGDDKPHVIGIGKNGLPTLMHGLPPFENIPSGVDAFGPVGLNPHRGHDIDIQALHRPVKPFVGPSDLSNDVILSWHGSSFMAKPTCD